MKKEIEIEGEKYFLVKDESGKKYFATNPDTLDTKIACICTKNKRFSAIVDGYAVFLICSSCGYKFEIYSG